MCGTLAEAIAAILAFLASLEGTHLLVTAGTEEERAKRAHLFNTLCAEKTFEGDTFENERARTWASVDHGATVIFAFGASTCHIIWLGGGVSVVYKKNPENDEIEAFKRLISSRLPKGTMVAAGLLAVMTPFEEELWKTVPAESFNTSKLGPKAANAVPYIQAFQEVTAGRSFKVGNRKIPTSYVTDALPEGVGKISGGDIKTLDSQISPFTLNEVVENRGV